MNQAGLTYLTFAGKFVNSLTYTKIICGYLNIIYNIKLYLVYSLTLLQDLSDNAKPLINSDRYYQFPVPASLRAASFIFSLADIRN